MSARDYKKTDAVAFGDSLGKLINAVRGDGVSAARFKELIGITAAAGAAVNEMKDVPEAAGEHAVGAILDTMGDAALERALEAEGPEPGVNPAG